MRSLRSLLFATSLGVFLGCTPVAQADHVVAVPGYVPRIALAVSPAKLRAPYDVQVIREGGETLPTYAQRGRYYVQGNAGERYVIRITNPTPNRVEAVVTVDGLDVIDGENGDLKKRGYIVPPYGETQIEGFRTSQSDVATFRFSSVAGSYAGKKGKARNVGVIAVALFEEQPTESPVIVTDPEPDYHRDDYRDYDGRPAAPPPAAESRLGAGIRDHSAKADAPSRSSDVRSAAPAGRAPATAPVFDHEVDGYGGDALARPEPSPTPARQRPGLGTEFGEQRYSAASFTRFVRAAHRPIAIAELRYNDAAGLMALGIPVAPMPDEGELATRETADPFPGDTRFARPPR